MKKYKLSVINSDSMNCSNGGVAPFLRNMHEDLSKVFDVEYYYIPDSWKKVKLPGRVKILVYLLTQWSKLKKTDFILSHIPEGTWLIGHLGVPYGHIYHGNSNPMTISKWWFGRYFKAIFDYFQKYINSHCPLIYSVGKAEGTVKKLFNPLDQNVKPKPYCDRKGLIFAGRLHPVKNVDRLIRIYSILPESLRKDLPFYIAGDGQMMQALKEQVDSLGISDQVKFLGLISNTEMMDIDSTKQILVMASSTEGFPTAIAEAFSVGVPVISTAVGDIPSVLHNNEQGFLFPLDFRDEDYANAIVEILNDYDRFSKAALKSSTLFNKSTITNEVIADILQIIEK